MTEPRIRLVYLLGASHSGSTLLALLLGSHPEIVTVGELKQTCLGDVNRYPCSCGAKILDCPFWMAIRARLTAMGRSFAPGDGTTDLTAGTGWYVRRLLRPLHRGPLLEALRDAALNLSPFWKRHLVDWRLANEALAETVSTVTGRPVLVDSSKIGIRLKFLLRSPRLEVRVLRVIRDGRAVMLTYMDPAQFADARNEGLRNGGTGGDRSAERLSSRQAAREWRRSNEEAACVLRGLPSDAWRETRYEDLCAAPQSTLRPLLAWLGVDTTPDLGLDRGQYHVVGNGMRLDSTCAIRVDDRWRTALSRADLAVFDSIAGDLNRRLGYP